MDVAKEWCAVRTPGAIGCILAADVGETVKY